MKKVIIAICTAVIGGIIVLFMFPGILACMNINTTGWKTLFQAGVKIIPYALTGIFVLWVIWGIFKSKESKQ